MYFLFSGLHCQAHGPFHQDHVLDDDRPLGARRRESTREVMVHDRPPALGVVGPLLGIVRLAVGLVALPAEVDLVVDVAPLGIAPGRRVLGVDVRDIKRVDVLVARVKPLAVRIEPQRALFMKRLVRSFRTKRLLGAAQTALGVRLIADRWKSIPLRASARRSGSGCRSPAAEAQRFSKINRSQRTFRPASGLAKSNGGALLA